MKAEANDILILGPVFSFLVPFIINNVKCHGVDFKKNIMLLLYSHTFGLTHNLKLVQSSKQKYLFLDIVSFNKRHKGLCFKIIEWDKITFSIC